MSIGVILILRWGENFSQVRKSKSPHKGKVRMIISKLMHKYALVRDKKPVSWSVGQFFSRHCKCLAPSFTTSEKWCWHQCAGMSKYRTVRQYEPTWFPRHWDCGSQVRRANQWWQDPSRRVYRTLPDSERELRLKTFQKVFVPLRSIIRK